MKGRHIPMAQHEYPRWLDELPICARHVTIRYPILQGGAISAVVEGVLQLKSGEIVTPDVKPGVVHMIITASDGKRYKLVPVNDADLETHP